MYGREFKLWQYRKFTSCIKDEEEVDDESCSPTSKPALVRYLDAKWETGYSMFNLDSCLKKDEQDLLIEHSDMANNPQ